MDNNDTMRHRQNFFNYFAYDDGSAERAYGLIGNGAKLAYRFKLNVPDTLRAIQVHFAHVNGAVNNFFTLNVWKNIAEGGFTEEVIYAKESEKPHYVDSLNGFYTFVIEPPLALDAGEVFIGMTQADEEKLNLGFDANNNSQSNLFYNVGGFWQTSTLDGAVMMRAMVGGKLPAYLDAAEPEQPLNRELVLYPNPAEDYLFISETEQGVAYQYSILDQLGRELDHGMLDHTIDISALPAGIYFLQLRSGQDQSTGNYKFIKVR